ncbi:MAG: mandelate racemase/muconate lactonizing enzyme family protein [Armatimonadetes bacterium]|nr:mandelate racemase/muconate lactonizing enzyme family protein [Armatimonadota bacterium]MDW8122918.1 mandelate racemase/muconate lactonizing enzyme family protein [Armatimonadota bacterium]
MKITDLRACSVRGNFEWILVRILTDEGIEGIGEAYWGIGVKDIILKMKPYLIGQNPMGLDRLVHGLYYTLSGSGSQAGAVVTAISGIEIALFDLVGKALGLPVWRLLGSKFRDDVRIYCDCHAGKKDNGQWDYTPEGYARRAREVQEKGFTALKFDIDVPNPYGEDYTSRSLSGRTIDFLTSLIAAAKEALDPSVELAVDCHWRFNTPDALRLAQALEPYELWWIEDPTPPENIEALATVTRSSPIPVCTGENLYTAHQFRQLIIEQACGIVAPDIPKVGGLREGQKIALLADLYYLPMAPHNVSSPVATMAAAHLMATIPHFLALEFHAIDVPWWDDVVVHDGPIIREGMIRVPDAPGLGLELNPDTVIAHAEDGKEFFS